VFDGDEMNLHAAQSITAEIELRHLAAIPYQIISPSGNAPIIGIYQDSLLGSNRFTRPNITFTRRDAMNLLMMYKNVNVEALREKEIITSFDVLTQITPPLTMKYKTKLFEDGEDYNTSNNILEITNGKVVRGQLEKSALGSGTKGILHRVFNDFGQFECANYIDDLQNVITEYMKSSSYSVGVSDLIADRKTNSEILQIITNQKLEVQTVIDKVHLGTFKNNTVNTNQVEFEINVNNILNKATEQSGKVGRKSLSKNNRFLIIVNSGSKGSLINISQMISCLGQQNVDGKRIPYGFDNRTLPHYSKYDDSPNARGFIENSYISGLTAPELFFHAMGGRIGLIDTAVKTSTTGYIQRRLIKGLEDLKVEYDMTVRNSKGKIVQFKYGDDNFDTTTVENQNLQLVEMSVEDIYMHYDIVGLNDYDNQLINIYTKGTVTRMKKQRQVSKEKCKSYINKMISARDEIVEHIFKFKNDSSLKVPVSFQNIIVNTQGQLNLNANSTVDITPLEAFELIEEYFEKLKSFSFIPPTKLFEIMYYFYLSPKELLVIKRFHRKALVVLLETIILRYKKAVVHPGEMVGVIAGQSIGEPTTQLSILRTEKVKIIRVNKNTQIPEMVSCEIGNLCDNIIDKLPEYTFDTGHKDSVETILEPLKDDYYIIGVDQNEKTHWNKISHISRHIVNGDMIRVKTRSGRVVETTMSHSHLIRKDQTVQAIEGKDMTVGMRIPVAKHIDNAFVKNTLEIAGKTYELDYLFGWFIGAYLAEGNLSKKKGKEQVIGTINISNISDYYIENTQKFAERFDRKCTIKSKTDHILDSEKSYTNTDTSFTYKPLAEFIMNTCGTGSFVKRVPDFAFIAPNEFKSGLISGYFDGDGNFMCDKLHHTIRVCSRSSQLIKDISLLLNYFDIFGSLHSNYRNGDNYYHLAISPKYAKIYQKDIGTNLHKDKLQLLVDYVDREDAYSLREDIDKIDGLGDIIAKCGEVLELPGQSRLYKRWKKKGSIGRNTLQKYIKIFESHENSEKITDELSILRQAASSNVIWDEITEIEKYTPNQTEYVYDFTVPSNQTFMTDYGVIVHNTLNSLIYEDKIVVRNSKKEVSVFEIGKFTEDQIKLSQKIDYMKDKDTTYAELPDYYEVPCSTENGETVWRRIEAVTRHPVINEDGTNTMLRVTTKGNREATATKAKSFLQLIDGKIQGVNGKDLKVGDYLPASRKPLDYTEKFTLDMREVLPPSEYIYGTEVEKAREVVDEFHWWSKHTNKTFVLPYSRSDSAYAMIKGTKKSNAKTCVVYQKGMVYTKTNSICNYTIPEYMEMDYDFGYLMGAYAAEGCCTLHQVSIANNDQEFFEPIKRFCERYNLTTKIYVHNNKGKEGWTSTDIRIYNTVLCKILENLCGKYSHKKQISDKIVFSNRQCILGFLDAYIGGDGCIRKMKNKIVGISMFSTSLKMLTDVMVMLKNLGISANIYKPKKEKKNSIGTIPENIQQRYILNVNNKQSQNLASLLNIKIKEKTERIKLLLNENFKYEFSREDLYIPNIVNGEMIMEERNNRMMDLEFDKIVNIEEVPNTTPYAYDLTVEDTRTFDSYNGLAENDTFHLSGVASKSNVTRGVPRIEEILRLTKNPKNPSITVHLKALDETEQDKAMKFANMMEYTTLIDLVKSVQIIFDPLEKSTAIEEDKLFMEQFYEFEDLVRECNGTKPDDAAANQKSKWIIRMDFDAEILLDKNITMDDIHFALKNSQYGNDINCTYTDYNSEKLIFRIRTNSSVFAKGKKKGVAETLDQTDEIYMLKNYQDSLLKNIILRGVNGILNVLPRKLQNYVIKEEGKFVRKDIWVLDTTGTNLLDVLGLDYIDSKRTYCNDIKEVFDVLGIEAARQTIYNEFVDVMEFSDVYINYHHLGLLCDRMTNTKDMVSIYRTGILNDDIGPISKSTFEVHTEVLLGASRHAEFDHMRGVSATVMMGQYGYFGTNSFNLVLDLEQMKNLESLQVDVSNKEDDIEKMFKTGEGDETCSRKNIEIKNNIESIKKQEIKICDDDYNMGF